MQTIIKRSGQREDFSIDKVRYSLAASSDEAKEPLNESDISRILNELQQILEGKEATTTQQVLIVVTGLLYTKGFFGVLEKYLGYKRQKMR